MSGTSMKHPECEDDWCLIKDSLKWSGPGKPGYWIDPMFSKHELHTESAPSMLARQYGEEL